jgi:transcriptional regulator with XRE-family HTH domain
MNITVKPRLTALLKERGLTQMQLSELSGVPQGSISRFDRNDRHVDAHIFAIARVLDVRVEDLFEVTYR